MLTNIDQARVCFDLLGDEDAPVVCMVHALMADMSLWSGQVAPLLKAGFRVLRIDLPGHGGSAPGPAPCDMSRLAARVVGLLDYLKIEQVHYVGLSIGGAIGQAVAINHPSRLHSLFLSDVPGRSAPTFRDMWDGRFKVIEESGSLGALAAATMDRVVTEPFKQKNPVEWAALNDTILETQVEGLRRCVEALSDFDFTEKSPGIKAPTLLVCGADDAATPPAEAKRIASLIPGARYVEIVNAKHYPNIEQREQFNKTLLDWLAAQRKS